MPFVLLLFMLFPALVWSQDYLVYHQNINRAQRYLLHGQHQEALDLYAQTFEQFEFEFARDGVHACEVAAFLKDHAATQIFVQIALRRGVPLGYFSTQPKFEAFRATSHWSQVVAQADSLAHAYQNGIDTNWRQAINAQFAADQAMRARCYRWHNVLWRPFLMKKWEKLNAQQVAQIVAWTQEKGFPGDRLIGIDWPEHHPKIDFDQLSAGMPIVILIHHYSQPNPSFDALFKAELAKGNLHPQHYGTICDFEAQFGKGKFEQDGFYGVKHRSKVEGFDYNTKRAAIGLLTLEEVKQLNQQSILYRFWNKLY